MHKLSPALGALGLGLLAACGSSDGIVRGPAPYGALVSSSEALKVVFDEVCMPVVLDGADFATTAKSRYMVEGQPSKDATGQSSQSFRLAAFGDVTATLWDDGTCMVGLERGNSDELGNQALAALASRGHVMKPGLAAAASNDGARVAFCNQDPRPLILAVTKPASKSSKRPALVAGLYRAKGGASDICMRSPSG
jgi:hypothetical protein